MLRRGPDAIRLRGLILAAALLLGCAPGYGATIEERVCHYPWDCPTAIRVFTCESRLGRDPAAYDLERDDGGFAQINRPTWERFFRDRYGIPWERLVLDDDVNLAAAWVVYREHERVFKEIGWEAWSCY